MLSFQSEGHSTFSTKSVVYTCFFLFFAFNFSQMKISTCISWSVWIPRIGCSPPSSWKFHSCESTTYTVHLVIALLLSLVTVDYVLLISSFLTRLRFLENLGSCFYSFILASVGWICIQRAINTCVSDMFMLIVQ